MPEQDPASHANIFGPIYAGSGASYGAGIAEDVASSAPVASGMSNVKMDLWDRLTWRLIRRSDDLLADGEGGTFAAGRLVIKFRPSDNVMLDARLPEEFHDCLIEFDYEITNPDTGLLEDNHGLVRIVLQVIPSRRPST